MDKELERLYGLRATHVAALAALDAAIENHIRVLADAIPKRLADNWPSQADLYEWMGNRGSNNAAARVWNTLTSDEMNAYLAQRGITLHLSDGRICRESLLAAKAWLRTGCVKGLGHSTRQLAVQWIESLKE